MLLTLPVVQDFLDHLWFGQNQVGRKPTPGMQTVTGALFTGVHATYAFSGSLDLILSNSASMTSDALNIVQGFPRASNCHNIFI